MAEFMEAVHGEIGSVFLSSAMQNNSNGLLFNPYTAMGNYSSPNTPSPIMYIKKKLLCGVFQIVF